MALIASALAVAACGSASPTPSPSASVTPTTRPAAGPFALLLTNQNRSGASYDVLLIDSSARVVARVTAKLPLIKAHQQLSLPLAYASSNGAYYLDGDAAIHLLGADGSKSLVKTIPQGASSLLGFAISPDSKSIAVSVITQQTDDTKTTGRGYVEDLRDSGGHAEIFNNTSQDAYRWPIAWYGGDIVDAVGSAPCHGDYGQASSGQPSAGITCATSLHVVDSASQNRVATMCEAPAASPTGTNVTWSLNGLVTPAGVACLQSLYMPTGDSSQPPPSTCTVAAVDLRGGHRNFQSGPCQSIPAAGCFLSPDGSRMACTSSSTQALGFLSSGGSFHSLGRKYTILGWIDSTHLMVGVDTTTLGVINADTGAETKLTVTAADQVQMLGVVGAAP
ncbi:MAG: hypothetical protein JF887_06355 [Candidatus Dormibacteraeota bacterium]|uniref:Uncharacterized protein n=1 Tax=Candidatus Amunia macphersoniae TaxID=3127014 RepID=A0A934N9H1_9BACT|nr:hypothetical protein [Candidatus Dormibacteraeota bacterium]